jgi:murein tripeptide amidase MpaA
MAIGIGSYFDSGNIEVVDATDPSAVRLRIRSDSNAEFFQWFHFRATGVRGLVCRFVIENASEAAYPKGWEGYRVCASYDRETWFRVPTDYDGRSLGFGHTPKFDAMYFAYFPPYPLERHRGLIARCLQSPRVRLEVPGQTVDGDDLDLLVVRGARGKHAKRACWFLARQHPGESMAEWWMEGFLDRLLDEQDPVAREVLRVADIYVAPNMNPDGSRRGNLRTNAAGANLNREWQEPTVERSPEVYYMRRRMAATGVDFVLDVHGDEALPYVFMATADHVPAAGKREQGLVAGYLDALRQTSPDFQTKYGYPKPATANLSMCATYLAETYGCPGMTLEMPVKDNANAPDARNGWTPQRSRKLGAACLAALHAILGDLT